MFEVRRYQERDAPAVWRLREEGLREVQAEMGEGPWYDDLRTVRESYVDAGGEFLVATIRDEVIAIAGLRRTSAHVGEITRMRVDRRFHRQGLGRFLLDALEASARELGFDVLRLETTTTQVPAQRLYRADGFTEHSRQVGFAGHETIVFEKRLA